MNLTQALNKRSVDGAYLTLARVVLHISNIRIDSEQAMKE